MIRGLDSSLGGIPMAEAPKAPACQPAQPISFTGLRDLVVQDAHVDLNLQLRPGQFELHIPAAEPPRIDVPHGTSATIVSNMEPDRKGLSVLKEVNIKFSKPVKILNPATAFKPGGGGSSFFDNIKNWLATVTINSIVIESNGKIRAHGNVSTFFSNNDFHEEIATILMPTMNMSLDQALCHKVMNFIVPGGAPPGAGPDVLSDIIRDVMRMSSGATFNGSATTLPAVVDFNSPWLHAKTRPEAVTIGGQGTLNFGAAGSITLAAESTGISVTSSAGHATMKGAVSARRDGAGKLVEEASVDMTFAPKAMTGEFKPAVGMTVPLELERGQANFHVNAQAHIENSQVMNTGGSLDMTLPSMSHQMTPIRIGDEEVLLVGDKATASASLKFAHDQRTGTTLSQGSFDMRAETLQATRDINGMAGRTLTITAKKVDYTEATNATHAEVSVTL